ncbi:hypothetical protein NUSPORA_00193 [Nucleospora cyclopteri]
MPKHRRSKKQRTKNPTDSENRYVEIKTNSYEENDSIIKNQSPNLQEIIGLNESGCTDSEFSEEIQNQEMSNFLIDNNSPTITVNNKKIQIDITNSHLKPEKAINDNTNKKSNFITINNIVRNIKLEENNNDSKTESNSAYQFEKTVEITNNNDEDDNIPQGPRHFNQATLDHEIKQIEGGKSNIEFDQESNKSNNISIEEKLANVQPFAITKSTIKQSLYSRIFSSKTKNYKITDYTDNDAINVPVKSAKTPYLGFLKKMAPVKNENDVSKNTEIVEMAKSTDKVVFDEKVIVQYNEKKIQTDGFWMRMIKKIFCCY